MVGRRSLCSTLVFLSLAVSALLYESEASARTLACPDLDTVFLDRFDTRLPTTQLSQPGPFPTQTRSGTTLRAGRSTPWFAVYPTGSPVPRPLLIFVPGFQISSASYAALMTHVATWGFVAVRVDATTGGLFPSHPEMALDVSAVLTDLLAPATLPISVDGTLVALSGHSLGGKIAVMVANADSRIDAVYAFDPVNNSSGNASQPNILPAGISQQTIPFGFAGELLDGSGSLQPCAPLALNYQTFFNAAASTPAAYEWTLNGASHTDFVTNPDQCGFACSTCRAGTLPTAVTHAFMRSSTVAFLRTYLLDEPGLCGWLNGADIPAQVVLRQRP